MALRSFLESPNVSVGFRSGDGHGGHVTQRSITNRVGGVEEEGGVQTSDWCCLLLLLLILLLVFIVFNRESG